MVIKIKQTWWHIEEIFYPHKGRKVRQVMDIYSNEQFLPISLDSKKFLGFRAYARSLNNKELVYLEDEIIKNLPYGSIYRRKPYKENFYRKKTSKKISITDNKIIINLGSLNDYPVVQENGTDNLRHIKMEIEYVELDPAIYLLEAISFKERFNNIFMPRYEGEFSVVGKIQPEFYITMPLGWRIGKVNYIRSNGDEEGDYFLLQRKYGCEEKYLKCEIPHISIIEGKRKYNYLISDLLNNNHYNQNNEEIPTYTCNYVAEFSGKVVGISLVPLIFWVIIFLFGASFIYNFISFNVVLNLGISAGMSYLILLLAYCYFYTAYIKDGYYLPHKNLFLYSVIGSLVIIFLIFCVALFDGNREMLDVIINQLFFLNI